MLRRVLLPKGKAFDPFHVHLKSYTKRNEFSNFGNQSHVNNISREPQGEPVQSLEMHKAIVDMKKIGNILKTRSFYGELLDNHHQV